MLPRDRANRIIEKVSNTSPIKPAIADYKIEGAFVVIAIAFKPQGFHTEWRELHRLSNVLRADDFTDPKPGFAIFRIHALSWR